MSALSSTVPQDADEADLISIEKIRIEADEVLAGAQVTTLTGIATSQSNYSNIAKSMLYEFGLGAREFYSTFAPKHLGDVQDASTFTIYPNPANSFVQFDYSIAEGVAVQLVVFDMAGKQVASYAINNQNGM